MIGILLIATGKYERFISPLLKQIGRYFLPEDKKVIHIFTDGKRWESTIRMPVVHFDIPSYKFPFATLYRYRLFSEQEGELDYYSHLFYLDVDMAIISKIGDEILTDGLIAVKHPGYYIGNRWGDNENPTNSTSYMPEDKRKHYFCGGFQGGTSDSYLELSKKLAKNIEEDERNGVMAQWQDETHFNKYINWTKPESVSITEFSPEYCMPEAQWKREKWGLLEFEPKILALEKEKDIRE